MKAIKHIQGVKRIPFQADAPLKSRTRCGLTRRVFVLPEETNCRACWLRWSPTAEISAFLRAVTLRIAPKTDDAP